MTKNQAMPKLSLLLFLLLVSLVTLLVADAESLWPREWGGHVLLGCTGRGMLMETGSGGWQVAWQGTFQLLAHLWCAGCAELLSICRTLLSSPLACLVSGLVVPCGCLQKGVVASGLLKAQVLWWASVCTLGLNKLPSVQWSASGGTTSTKASCREATSVSSEQGDVLENYVLQSPVQWMMP